jgi:hypothetical protein
MSTNIPFKLQFPQLLSFSGEVLKATFQTSQHFENIMCPSAVEQSWKTQAAT